MSDTRDGASLHSPMIGLAEAENLLTQLAGAFVSEDPSLQQFRAKEKTEEAPDLDTRYRTLVEQIPAVIFLASLDEGISKAYVSPISKTP